MGNTASVPSARSTSGTTPRRRTRLLGVVLLLVAGLSACGRDGLPEPSSEAYRDAVASFYTGVSAIQAGAHQQAEESLERVTELAPDEPSSWANLGLLALRENRLEAAQERLTRARALAPENGQIAYLSGMLELRQGRSPGAVVHLRRALELDPRDLKAAHALLQVVEGGGTGAAGLIDSMRAMEPDNLVVLLEQARVAARELDADRLHRAVDELERRTGTWPDAVTERLSRLENAAARAGVAREALPEDDPPEDNAQRDAFEEAASHVAFLRNELQQLSAYRADLAAVQHPEGQEGDPLNRFLRLPTPPTEAAAPDTTLHFTPERLAIDGGPWTWVRALPLAGSSVFTLSVANGHTVTLGSGASFPFPGGDSERPPTWAGIAAFDLDNDYRTDLVLAGSGGLRLLKQESLTSFADVTAETGLSEQVRGAAYVGAWAADLDQEGDLDLVVATESGAPRVLRNNGDGTFAELDLFQDMNALRDLVWCDLDADGDLDVVLLDEAGRLHAFDNDRAGRFERFEEFRAPEPARAFTAADVDADSRMELLVLDFEGTIHRIAAAEDAGWEQTVLARWDAAAGGAVRLFAADLDNSGRLDLLAAGEGGGQVWLSGPAGGLQPHAAGPGPRLFDVADLSGSGRLDLVGLSEEGQPVHLLNESDWNYASKSIQVQAASATGDQRINSFGIGGTVEVRAGLMYQKQRITAPVVHFGLGRQDVVHVARITWPNGTMQAEFELATDQTVLAQQRLKGSCPWIFTHDGEKVRFVTDFLWRTALGLRINAQEGTSVMHGVDWVKIDGEELKPKEGLYDVRITAELWETHFFDQVMLMSVDHPADTEIFVDERFSVHAPTWAVHAMAPPRPVSGAVDSRGRDVTDLVHALDGRYLDTFELGAYQGVAEEHYVEVSLENTADDGTASGPRWLVASGWVRPTDSSINLAISQGSQDPPRGLRLEVPDGKGGWKTAQSDLGFPAGKAKTILIDLQNALPAEGPHVVRLRTNMEIYWDRLAWAPGRPDSPVRTQRLGASSASLRYRGFSVVRQAGHSAPELPDYDTLQTTGPLWRDLIGYHTRFGDVGTLIASTDDRYVIMNAGDELRLGFEAPPPPPEGWVRDFVLIGDGWVKDGDYNTGHSATVRPLPYHGLTDYSASPRLLEDDPVYQRHASDWETYHTRYVTPEPFQRALLPLESPGQ
jgi:Tfp pilus assembly protein PilF